MNGVRFYEEYKDKKGNESARNCLAITDLWWWSTGRKERVYDSVVVLRADATPNTPALCGGGVSQSYLRKHCKRVSESRAREIHPNLFVLLKDWGW